MIVVLTGGTGGAKFVQGLAAVIPADQLTVIVNTGDDLVWWGLHVSPDIDSIVYALAGMLSRERGWGVEGDTFHCLERMRRMGAPGWFQLGDRDLATHLRRTELLASEKSLAQATAEIARELGVASRVLPMSNQPVDTRVLTAKGELSFQEYFVRERYEVPVTAVRFAGAEKAEPAPGVLAAITQADTVVIAPSNPITSIGPILAVPGIRDALRRTPAPVAAISPIVGGAAVSGPAGELMETQGLPVSAAGVAQAYSDFLDLLVADTRDAGQISAASCCIPHPSPKPGERVGHPVSQLSSESIAVRYTNTLMKSEADKAALARAVLGFVNEQRVRAAAS